MAQPNYNEDYVAHLFDQMGSSYALMNLVSSFGFSEIWRAQCVASLPLASGTVVADLMAGSGECWPYLRRRIQACGRIIAVDISPVMCRRQQQRASKQGGHPVQIHCENALALSLPTMSVDFVVSAFGLKTFNDGQLAHLAAEMFRVLRPGGSGSLIEISLPENTFLRFPYCFYLNHVIPWLGRSLLKDIECYKMLGVYTEAFGSCRTALKHFQNAGFAVLLKQHFFGCATSLILKKRA
jgi:demethylmenaquinone methyltransferase/2-methoxy-6-polyprenyl-1,4-benzoquinol methylase